ncbi:hypothetical protein TNCV_3733241 [Trichonephila clavipes]|nr:hypothetical protein TNCV_3733241 [Trichonephila clavipes]
MTRFVPNDPCAALQCRINTSLTQCFLRIGSWCNPLGGVWKFGSFSSGVVLEQYSRSVPGFVELGFKPSATEDQPCRRADEHSICRVPKSFRTLEFEVLRGGCRLMCCPHPPHDHGPKLRGFDSLLEL